MKKKVTSFLLVAVILLWGVIIYRIFIPRNEKLPLQAAKAKYQPVIVETPAHYELLANYRDPFSQAKAPLDSAISNGEVMVPEQRLEPQVEPIPVRFGGMIQNPKTNKQIIILNIDGRDVMFTDGATAQNVTFLRNFDTHVQILYHGKIETIYK